MRVVNRECVGIIPTHTTSTGIGKVLETVETSACGIVLVREFCTHQIIVGEAMVDLDIKLLIGALARTRCEPVLQKASAGEVGFWKVAHHFLRHRVNQIAGARSWRKRAVVSGEVVEGNDGAAYGAALIVVENPGPRVPNLASIRTALPGAVKRASFFGTKFAEITCPHGVAGNACFSRLRAGFSSI